MDSEMKFDAIYTILNPNSLAVWASNLYFKSEDVQCQILKTGINHTYLLKTGPEKYVLRVYVKDWRSKGEINEELRFLLNLKKEGINVSYPITNAQNELINELNAPEGVRFAVLFSFAEGDKIRSLGKGHCNTIGKTMASLHLSSLDLSLKRVTYNHSELCEKPILHLQEFFDKEHEGILTLKKIESYLCPYFNSGDVLKCQIGAIHMDIWYDNMNIDFNGKVTLFDFDFCGNGPLVLDVAYFLTQLFHSESDKDIYLQKANVFIKGYESVRPLKQQEKDMIAQSGIAVWVFYLGVQASRFDDWSNLFFTANYLKHFVGLIQNWANYYEIDFSVK